jgi:hypothetical protein
MSTNTRGHQNAGLEPFRAKSALVNQAWKSTLAGFESTLRLVDDIDAPLAPYDAIVAMAATQRFE